MFISHKALKIKKKFGKSNFDCFEKYVLRPKNSWEIFTHDAVVEDWYGDEILVN